MYKDKLIWCLNRFVIYLYLFSGIKFIIDCIIFMLVFIVLIKYISVI